MIKIPRIEQRVTNVLQKQLRDTLVYLLMMDIKRQVSEGRPGPNYLDFNQICSLIEQGTMKIQMVEGNPSYPELIFDP